MKRYRFPDISATEAGCTVCGLVFIDAASFDVHRGITAHPVSETATDLGRCLTIMEMDKKGLLYEVETDRWGTQEAVIRAARFRAMREARGK